jgi:hypothetical protein
MLQLLEALACQPELSIWRLLSLFDKCVQHSDSFAHHEAVEGATYARVASRPSLEQASAQWARMWQSKTRAVLDQQLNKARIICKDIDRPRFDLSKDTLMEILDLKRHAPMLPNTLTWCNQAQKQEHSELLCAAARFTRQENWKVRLSFLRAWLQKRIPDPFVFP